MFWTVDDLGIVLYVLLLVLGEILAFQNGLHGQGGLPGAFGLTKPSQEGPN